MASTEKYAAPTDAKALAREIRADLGVTGPRTKLPGSGAWAAFARFMRFRNQDWPFAVEIALTGIEYARSTGRLPGSAVGKLDTMSDWQVCGLVADIAVACPTMGDVPGYLIDRLADSVEEIMAQQKQMSSVASVLAGINAFRVSRITD